MLTPLRMREREPWTPRLSLLPPIAASFVPSPGPNTATFHQHNVEKSDPAVQRGQTKSLHYHRWNPNVPSITAELQCDINDTVSAQMRVSTRACIDFAEGQRAYILSQCNQQATTSPPFLITSNARKVTRRLVSKGLIEALEQRLENSQDLHTWLQSKYLEYDNEVNELMADLVASEGDVQRPYERMLESMRPQGHNTQAQRAALRRGRARGQVLGRGRWYGRVHGQGLGQEIGRGRDRSFY